MSGSGFDWRLLHAPEWTPLSRLRLSVTHVVGGLYAASSGMYVMTNQFFGGTEDDPGVGAFLWARTLHVARLIYEGEDFDDAAEAGWSQPPPVDVLGFEPLNYGGVLRHAEACGIDPSAMASYNVDDGRFQFTTVDTAVDRAYYFRSRNTPGAEAAMALRFTLHMNGKYAGWR